MSAARRSKLPILQPFSYANRSGEVVDRGLRQRRGDGTWWIACRVYDTCENAKELGELFEAAPDLYEALAALVADLEEWGKAVEEMGRRPRPPWRGMEKARAALAQARREQA